MEWEVSLIESMQSILGDSGSFFEKALSFFGDEKGLMIVIFIVMFCYRKETGQKLGLIISATNGWLAMIKAVVLRPRPYMEHPDRVKPRTLVKADAAADDVAAQGYSFPSMHSASVPALYITLARDVQKRWMWIVAIVLTILVGLSRVTLGMHYPTDVITGWILGFAIIGIFSLLDKYIANEWIRHLILFVSMLPGVFFVRTHDYFTSLGALIGIVAAIHYERKYVGYTMTKNKLAMVLRILGAFVVYLVLNTILKLPFDKAFLENDSLAALLVRTVRYAIIMFVITGVYPKAFPFYEKIGKGSGTSNNN